MEEKTLKQIFEGVAESYCKRFDTCFFFGGGDYGWVGDKIGGVLSISDFFLDYDDVRYIIDNNIDFTTWVDWYEYCERIGCIRDDIPVPSVEQWCSGFCRIDEEKIQEMEVAAKRLEEATIEFETTVDKYAKGGF